MAKGTINVVIAGNSELLNKELQAVERRLKRFGNGLKFIGDSIFTSVGVPFIAAGAAGVKAASDFESSLSKIKGLVGIAGEDLKQLENAALRLGPQMGKSATEAAEALFFITSAGLKGKDAIDVLEMSLKASAAGLGEVSTIADLATSVMNAYGAENVSAANATDTLTAAVREGKLQADTLAGAVSAVLPIASAMGVQFNEVGAAFAAMSRTGTSADEAATQLKGILSSLLKPTVEAEKALSEMGLSSEMLRQQIKEEGLLSVLELLNNRFDGNTAATAKVFGNVRALTGVLDLMGKNADGTRQIFERMNAVAGDTDKAFEAAAQTTEFKFNQALAKLNSAAIKLGAELIPIVTNIVDSITKAANWFTNLDDSTRSLIVSTLKWTTILGGTLSVVGRMITSIAQMSAAFRAIKLTNFISSLISLNKFGSTSSIVLQSIGIAAKSLWTSILLPLTAAVGAAAVAFEGLSLAMGEIEIRKDKELTFLESVALGYRQWKKELFGAKEELESLNDKATESVKITEDQLSQWQKMNPHLKQQREEKEKQKEQEEKLNKIREESTKRLEEINGVYSNLREELQILTSKQELYGGSLNPERVSAYQSAIDNLLKLGISPASKGVQDLYDKMVKLQQALSERTVKPLTPLTSKRKQSSLSGETDFSAIDISGLVPDIDPFENMGYNADEFASKFPGMIAGIQEFGSVISNVAASGIDSFNKLGNAALFSAMKAAKGFLVEAAMAYLATTAKLGPIGLALAGAGISIISGMMDSAISKAQSKKVPALAQGGMTTGPGMAMIGDNASGKEFVIPFERMGEFARQAMGGNNVNVAGEFRVKGSDLILVLERANRITSAKRGYGLNG